MNTANPIHTELATETDATNIDLAEYAALTTGAALQSRDNAGVLRVGDADRRDFLHRMTTANINALAPGQSAVTVLTSPTARILFVFTVLCRAGDLLLLPAAGQADALARHLRSQIFFMDKVKVENVSADWARLRLLGPQVDAVLQRLGWAALPDGDNAWLDHDGIIALRQDTYDLPGVELLTPVAHRQSRYADLLAAGAIPLTSDTAYTARRLELARPLPGVELVEAYTPLEAGLAWACADNKGCYTGQEIIARQVTYDKVTKTLVQLVAGAPLSPGAEVKHDGAPVGSVTSAAYSPALGQPIALAIVKRPANTPGAEVHVGDIPARVLDLSDTHH